MSTASLSITEPASMTTDDSPSNVSATPVPGSTDAPSDLTATCAAPTSTVRVPKTFVNATRTRDPPMLARTI